MGKAKPKRDRKPAAPAASELLMNEGRAAELLLLSVRTLQRWRVEGRGPRFVKLGKRVFYTRASLEKTAADAERQSTSEPAA